MSLKETHSILLKHRKTIAVAESCTGGLISHTLTNISGSSSYFKLGLVVYSNESKSKILNIPHKQISRFGAVSKEVAFLMANNVRKLAKTDIGIATTGIAGPTGATKKKPIGTVYIAISHKHSTKVKKILFRGSRTQIKNKTKDRALSIIKECLKKK